MKRKTLQRSLKKALKKTNLFKKYLKIPSVVTEILAGVVLANLALAWPALEPLRALSNSRFLNVLGEIGVILLLFEVGLESQFEQLKRVGGRALMVALVGVGAPVVLTLLGWRLGLVSDVLPDGSHAVAVVVFIAATLTATSVGITASVLNEAKQLASRTGQLILNAAVIDDVLGLLILAATAALVSKGVLSARELGSIALKAVLFFAVFVGLGRVVLPKILKRVWRWQAILLATVGVGVCFSYAWAAHAFGLAPVVGAFFAGLLLDDPTDKMRLTLKPVVRVLSPIFFVLVGTQVHLDLFAGAAPILILLSIAIAGKLLCGLVAGPGADKVAVGIGMAPRGEVGLIFVATGRQLGVLSEGLYATLVFVVMLSTLIPVLALGAWFASKGAGKKLPRPKS